MNVLEEQWISQANARQRRGRAGRVRSGVCYHLATRFTVDGLRDFSVPEMLRMSLEDIVLQVHFCIHICINLNMPTPCFSTCTGAGIRSRRSVRFLEKCYFSSRAPKHIASCPVPGVAQCCKHSECGHVFA